MSPTVTLAFQVEGVESFVLPYLGEDHFRLSDNPFFFLFLFVVFRINLDYIAITLGHPCFLIYKIVIVTLLSVSHSVMFDSCNPMDCRFLCQTRILEWVAIPFSRGSSQPRD